ncbi:hypothetical protein [Cohnella zeiphila]|uniref:Uncharacterized protein n=1 Tax=Cohnella zeiphila TaxID=2761120 RepID=A0A7X0VTW5_9BACL|nr:hypothetical protein [Cohnella zeiphila]MBB6730359.1 hypothetical protein [Cohnella zeiphila]
MLKKNGDVESFTEASSPTPTGQEDVTPTDMLSEAVKETVDRIEELFGGHPEEKFEDGQ